VIREVRENAHTPAVLYWNNPFGAGRWRRAEQHFLSRWLSFVLQIVWCLFAEDLGMLGDIRVSASSRT